MRRKYGVPFAFTPISRVFLDDWLPELNEAELKCQLYVYRRTYGTPRRQREAQITYAEFVKHTGRPRTNVYRALASLKAKGLLKVGGPANGTRTYEILFRRNTEKLFVMKPKIS